MKPLMPRCFALPLLLAGLLSLSASATASPGLPSSAEAGYPWHLAMSDQQGRRFDIADYRGKTLLLGFMFTNCSSACPLQTARMARVQSLLPEDLKARTRILSISIDPERDSTAALAAYAEAFRADTGHWRFGATRDGKALGALMERLGVTLRSGADGAPDHKMAVLLIDAGGRIMQRYIGDRLDENRIVAEMASVDRLFGVR